ncbi:hypothetical protein ACE6H2_019937 [Prunus campanulata]
MAAALAGDDLTRQSSSRGSWQSISVREMWNAPDIFERSGRQQTVDEEEEELKWAAIERLPTYDRMRRGMVGIDVPKVEVRFQNLSIEGDAYVGTRALPTLLNSTLNSVEGLIGMLGLTPSKKRVVHILQDVSGIVQPSRSAHELCIFNLFSGLVLYLLYQ